MSLHAPSSVNIVLLGASNLTLCRNHAVASCAKRTPEGARIFIADGLGRSYIARSRALARGLPSIAECGIWQALEATPAAKTWALLTDVGNDLVYGRTPKEILDSVEQTLDKLETSGARCALTGLPLDAIQSTSWLRFHFFKTVLFPFHPLSRIQLIEDAVALERGLREVAEARDLGFAAPRPDWYGPDPIHVYGKAQVAAYELYLEELLGPPTAEGHAPPAGYRRTRRLPHADRTYFGRRQTYEQPSLRLEGNRFVVSVF